MSTLLVTLIVVGAVLFLGRRIWATAQSARPGAASGCGDGCGCGETAQASAADDWSGDVPRSVRG